MKSLSVIVDSIANQSTNMAAIEKLQVRITKYLMCIYAGRCAQMMMMTPTPMMTPMLTTTDKA